MVHHEGIHRDVRVRSCVTQHLAGALHYRTLGSDVIIMGGVQYASIGYAKEREM